MKTMKCTTTFILNCMNKWYKKWIAVIWATIISCVFIIILFFVTNTCSAKYIDSTLRKSDYTERVKLKNTQSSMSKVYQERLDDLFSKWDSILEEDRNELRNTLKTISICLSIWIGLIAAICTILPIVMGINVNSSFQKDINGAENNMMDKIRGLEDGLNNKLSTEEKSFNEEVTEIEKRFQKKVEESEAKIDSIIEKQEQKIQQLNTTLKGSVERSKKIEIAQTLSDLSVHMRVISELQEFESHDKATLTKAPLLQRALENLVVELGHIKEDIQYDNNEETIFVSILLIWCMLKRLLTAVESSFTDYNLLTLQKLKSKIDNEIMDRMKVLKGEAKNKILISLSYDYAVEIEKLFKEYIKDNDLEQKD